MLECPLYLLVLTLWLLAWPCLNSRPLLFPLLLLPLCVSSCVPQWCLPWLPLVCLLWCWHAATALSR